MNTSSTVKENNVQQEGVKSAIKDTTFKKLSSDKARYGGKIYSLDKKVSENISLYKSGGNHILHARAKFDTTRSKIRPKVSKKFTSNLNGVAHELNTALYTQPYPGNNLGYYNNSDNEQYISRQIATYRNLEVPNDAKYKEASFIFRSYEPLDNEYQISYRNGEIGINLITGYINPNSPSQPTYSNIMAGQRLESFDYNSSDITYSAKINDDYNLSLLKSTIESGDDLNIGLLANEESYSGAYTELNYVDFVLEYDIIEPEIIEAKYHKWSQAPLRGDVPEKGADLAVIVKNWPENAIPQHIIFENHKSIGAAINDTSDIGVIINARIIRATTKLPETSQEVDLSDRLVFTDAEGNSHVLEIKEWSRIDKPASESSDEQ